MFNFKGFLSAVGIILFITIFVSFVLGFFRNIPPNFTVGTIFIVTYISLGIAAPYWNPNTPYFATFICSVTLTVLNIFFAIFFMDIFLLTSPISVNNSILYSTLVSLSVALFYQKIRTRQGE